MINSVRNTVLSVLNKNNYGYISPSDFNLFAQQAQMELYEEYFSNYNKAINFENQRQSGTDYADLVKPLAEVLENFLVLDFLRPIFTGTGPFTNQFEMPSVTSTGNDAYMVSRVVYYNQRRSSGTNTSPSTTELIDTNANFILDGVQVGDIVVNTTAYSYSTVLYVVSNNELIIAESIFDSSSDLGYSVFSSSNVSEPEKVTDGKIAMLNVSSLTAPSTMFPAYTLNGVRLTTYPSLLTGYGAVRMSYFRYPKPPKWTYISLSGGEPAFDQSQSDYQDFELPNEDEYKLAMKILQYCGISIREQQVVQYAMAQEQHEQPTFSQQQ